LLILIAMPGWAQVIYHTGNEDPVETNHLPGLVLAGGRSDNNDAMQWMLERADGGDVVVLRASGSDGYNDYFYSGLGVGINSVTSIVITGPEDTESPEVLEILGNAEVVFIAGGNQWHYVNEWQDSPMLDLLNDLISDKQITIGGTSAGMAVLGEVVFSAEEGTVWSSEALGNPYHFRVKLEKDFLDVPFMQQTVTDSHYNRIHDDGMDRHGRHVTFMARMVADWDMDARGIAANEYTAIAVDETGKARVFGHPNFDDYAYFLQKYGGPPETCTQGEPLHWEQGQEALKVYKIKGDFEGTGWFSLDNYEEGDGGEWQYWYVSEGELVVVTDDDTHVQEPLSREKNMKLFPNPAADILTVTLAEPAMKAPGRNPEIRIFSAAGTLVRREIPADPAAVVHTINVSDLPPGTYILTVSSENGSFSKSWTKE